MAARAGALVTAALRGDQAITDGLDRRRAGPAGVSRFLQVALHRRQRDGAPGPRIGYGFLRNQPMVLLVGSDRLARRGWGRLSRSMRGSWAGRDPTDAGPGGHRQARCGRNRPAAFAIARERPERRCAIPDRRRPRRRPMAGAHHGVAPIPSGPERHSDRQVIDADGVPGGRPSLVIDGEFHPLARLDEQSAGGVTIELDTNPAVYAECGDFLIEPRENESRTRATGSPPSSARWRSSSTRRPT